jgi:hypothetical protein
MGILRDQKSVHEFLVFFALTIGRENTNVALINRMGYENESRKFVKINEDAG